MTVAILIILQAVLHGYESKLTNKVEDIQSEISENMRMVVPVPEAEKLDAIDGEFSIEELNKTATRIIGGVRLKAVNIAPNSTTAWLKHKGHLFYIAVRAEYKGNLNVKALSRDDEVWQDECVELYIQPDSTSPEYYQWAINPNGIIFDSKGHNPQWNGTIISAVKKYDNYWNIELLIDLSQFNVSNTKTTSVMMNITRNDKSGITAVQSSLSLVRNDNFHDINNFFKAVLSSEDTNVKVTHDWIAGGPNISGFNVSCSLGAEISASAKKIVSSVYGLPLVTKIDENNLAMNGNIATYDHMIKTEVPLVNSVQLYDERGRIVARICQPVMNRVNLSSVPSAKGLVHFEWKGNKIGLKDAPSDNFNFIKRDGDIISCWGRRYDIKGSGMINQISSNGSDLLSSPVQLLYKINGVEKSVSFGKSEVEDISESEIKITRYGSLPDKSKVSVKYSFERDGLVFCAIEFDSNMLLEGLRIEIPCNKTECQFFVGAGNNATNEQVKLINQTINVDQQLSRTVWVGNERVGLSLYSGESDKYDRLKSLRNAVSLKSNKSDVILTRNFITLPVKISKETRYEFGLQAGPAKQLVNDVDSSMAIVTVANSSLTGTVDAKLQDYPGQEEEFVEWLSRQGVKKIIIFNEWAKYQGGHVAVNPEQIKRTVERAHRLGMKVLLYRSQEFSDAEPCWNDLAQKVLITPSSYGYKCEKPVPQSAFGWCPRSIYQDYFIWSCDYLMKEYDIDGFYLDGFGVPSCNNTLHGCGYKMDDGSIEPTSCYFESRRMMKRLYNVVKAYKKNGSIDVHGGTKDLVNFSFADGVWFGEQYWKLRAYDSNPARVLPLDVFRALMLPCSSGLNVNFLAYPAQPFSIDEAIALSFIHGVSTRPHDVDWPVGRLQLMKTSPIWSAIKRYEPAVFVPYWSKDSCIESIEGNPPKQNIKISYYKRVDGNVLMLMCNFGAYPVQAEIKMKHYNLKDYSAVDAISRERVMILQNGKVRCFIEPWKIKIIELNRK